MNESIWHAGLAAMVLAATGGVFSAPSLENFMTLACGWLLSRARRTTTGLIVAAGAVGTKHFGCFHRFFSQATWDTRRLWLGLFRLVGSGLCPVGQLVLVGDDTVQAKCGRKIAGAANWRNACGSTRQQYRFLWGLNLVILGMAVDFCGKTFCLPINLRLYRKEKDCLRTGCPYRTRSELMRQMVEEALEALPPRPVVLLVDGGFATATLLRGLPQRLTVITRLRRDAAIWRAPITRAGHGSARSRGRPAMKGARLPTPEQLAQDGRRCWQGTPEGRQVKTFEVLWYAVTRAQSARLVIIRQQNPREPYGHFLCTDASWQPDAILSTYGRRWSIEITIRDAKQHGGLGDVQCRVTRAVERQHAFTLAMMTLVMAWYIEQGHDTDRRGMFPWYRHKRGPTFQDMLTHARRVSLLNGFSANSARAPDLMETQERLLRYLQTAA
jgi:hypothetical protein